MQDDTQAQSVPCLSFISTLSALLHNVTRAGYFLQRSGAF